MNCPRCGLKLKRQNKSETVAHYVCPDEDCAPDGWLTKAKRMVVRT